MGTTTKAGGGCQFHHCNITWCGYWRLSSLLGHAAVIGGVEACALAVVCAADEPGSAVGAGVAVALALAEARALRGAAVVLTSAHCRTPWTRDSW